MIWNGAMELQLIRSSQLTPVMSVDRATHIGESTLYPLTPHTPAPSRLCKGFGSQADWWLPARRVGTAVHVHGMDMFNKRDHENAIHGHVVNMGPRRGHVTAKADHRVSHSSTAFPFRADGILESLFFRVL